MARILDSIHSPRDLKNLEFAQLAELAQEIRDVIVETCLSTGGHLGSGLGAVELIIGIHTVLDTPEDAVTNHAVWLFFCFTLDDWPRGLRHLAKSGDPKWADVARAEQSTPEKAAEQTALAGQWMALSKDVEASRRRALLERAQRWYERARPNLSALKRIAVDRSLKQIKAELARAEKD